MHINLPILFNSYSIQDFDESDEEEEEIEEAAAAVSFGKKQGGKLIFVGSHLLFDYFFQN